MALTQEQEVAGRGPPLYDNAGPNTKAANDAVAGECCLLSHTRRMWLVVTHQKNVACSRHVQGEYGLLTPRTK